MAQVTHTHCPACRSANINEKLTARDYLATGEMFHINECSDCGFRFTNPVPDPDDIGRYYDSPEYVSHNLEKGWFNKTYARVRRITLRNKRRMIERECSHKQGRILDIGSGTGEFLNEMQLSGWSCKGLEPEDKARELAKANYQLDIGTPDSLFNIEGPFDVITMWHVLEHVHDLDRYMERINELLADDGLLVLALPNFDSFDGAHYGAAWDGYDVPRHLYHFHPRSLEALVTRHGYKLDKLSAMPFDPFYLAILSERHKRFNGTLHKGSKGNVISAGIIGGLAFLKARVNAKKGSSVMYLVRKDH